LKYRPAVTLLTETVIRVRCQVVIDDSNWTRSKKPLASFAGLEQREGAGGEGHCDRS
jgi:hypothetical protein